jgi:acetoin:2,6-dichlorophenolindophenol oxidoreductase subunit beta
MKTFLLNKTNDEMEITYGEAIREALYQELKADPLTVLFGEDIRYNLYGYTDKLVDIFGTERVIDTPLSEAAVVGTSVGAAMCGLRTIVDLTVANFLFVAMDQLVSIASKTNYMYNGQFKLPVTIMCATLYNGSNSAQHSDRPHPLFMNMPGFKVIAPSSPQDAYSLLRSAIRDNNPVIFFSDRSVFYSKEDVDFDKEIEIGKAAILQEGDDITIISISGCRKAVLNILPELERKNISAEVIDLRTLIPLDKETILKSVRKTGRVVIADTANKTCSAASEISSILAEEAFFHIKAPIGIVAHEDVPVPFAKNLEIQLLPTQEKLLEKVMATMVKTKDILQLN